MKILLLTPDLPYPSESGAALRNIGILRGLHAAGHRVSLLSFADQPEIDASNPLWKLCDTVEAVGLPRRGKATRLLQLARGDSADMELRLHSPDFAQALGRLLHESDFDLIQFSGLELGCYAELILQQRKRAKVVYDALNAEAELQRLIAAVDRRDPRRLPAALYSTIQGRRLTRFEREICRCVDAVIAVSDEDRRFLSAHDGAPCFVLPNGVNAADYAPPPGNKRDPKLLVFSGKMDYRPNVDAIEWLCRSILPLARQHERRIRLRVVGRNPHPRLQALAQDAGVEITGWVEAVQPHLHQAAVYVAPLRMGSGTRLKLLQAMAAGCAVASTPVGAAGLSDALRDALVIADDAPAFAREIALLLGDETRRRDLGERAQELATRHYDWSALMPRLLRAYAELGLG